MKERYNARCLLRDKVIAKCNQDSKRYQQLVSDIMKIKDERETKKLTNEQTKTEKNMGRQKL